MQAFNPITLADKPLFDRYLYNSGVCYYNFTNIFMWREMLRYEYAIINDMLCIKRMYNNEQISFFMPIGRGAYTPVFEKLKKETGVSVIKMHPITESMKGELESEISGIKFTAHRSMSEYIYLSERLISLSGKTLHAKRNFINRFKTLYDWEYQSISHENISLCREAADQWFRDKGPLSLELLTEQQAISSIFDNWDVLQLRGGMILVGGRPAAFSIGEKIADNMAMIHIEKALKDFEGAYPMINNQTVTHEFPDVQYINREEDLGLENLRKAKMSYKPDILSEIYSATIL